MKHEAMLEWLLRIFGVFSLCALPFVFVPHSVMDAIHRGAGLGELPDAPIVGYLARSTSAFYALVGALLWKLSLDVRAHREVIAFLGAAIAAFGAVLLFVDWTEALPTAWKLWEGPFVIVLGLAIRSLSLRAGDAVHSAQRGAKIGPDAGSRSP